jgi:hypothetical protein
MRSQKIGKDEFRVPLLLTLYSATEPKFSQSMTVKPDLIILTARRNIAARSMFLPMEASVVNLPQ